jgi:hypothetical protein
MKLPLKEGFTPDSCYMFVVNAKYVIAKPYYWQFLALLKSGMNVILMMQTPPISQ